MTDLTMQFTNEVDKQRDRVRTAMKTVDYRCAKVAKARKAEFEAAKIAADRQAMDLDASIPIAYDQAIWDAQDELKAQVKVHQLAVDRLVERQEAYKELIGTR